VITFTAPTADVDAWLASSPGVHDAVVKAEGEARRYLIKPGGGAAFAAVVIDGSTHVTIRTYWSWRASAQVTPPIQSRSHGRTLLTFALSH
jgi:hypothetical protein